MVLKDIEDDYTALTNIINSGGCSFLKNAVALCNFYEGKRAQIIDNFLVSQELTPDRERLVKGLHSLEKEAAPYLGEMNSAIGDIIRQITVIEHQKFQSNIVTVEANRFRESMIDLVRLISAYATGKINNTLDKSLLSKIVKKTENVNDIYTGILNAISLLRMLENDLNERMPDDFIEIETTEIYSLDIRSYRQNTDISSFSSDMRNLANFCNALEGLVASDTARVIYLQRIESGSLFASFISKLNIFEFLPDFLKVVSEELRQWAMQPAEREKIKAETAKTFAEANKTNAEAVKTLAEADRINAEAEKIRAQKGKIETEAQTQYICMPMEVIQQESSGYKMLIIENHVGEVCDSLKLDKNDPVVREQVERMLIPLISYMEANPVGEINGTPYDISNQVYLLEEIKKD